ncbi:MAG: hypothetical protein AAF799_11460 [Myxococcota bacterium]
MIAAALHQLWWAPGQAAGDDNPFAMFADWDASSLMWLGLLVPVAVVVFFVGSKRFRSQMGAGAIIPRGRDRFVGGRVKGHGPQWRATVERLQERPPTAIAEATPGPVRIEAEIVRASGNLGGSPGRECVWRNRAGAGPQTAVGADLLIVADATGRCGVEEFEAARINAPVERAGAHYESVALYVGDRIEVVGTFEADRVGEHEDPAMLVYGTLGTDGRVEIRVLERPAPVETPPETTDDDEP